MTVRTAWLSFMTAAVVIGVPALAGAQLPSSFQTPGAKGKANEAQICAADFEATVKPIAKWQRDQALEKYGKRPEDFTGELDHLIPVSLGGSNDPDNLWPLPDSKTMGPAQKKELDLKLHQMVCDKAIKLKDAQDAIKKDWVKAYNEYVKGAK
jgi:ribonuclease HII